MHVPAVPFLAALSSLLRGFFARPARRLGLAAVGLSCALTGEVRSAEPAAGDFGKDIQLAPFMVQGKSLAIDIHARTKSDRRYAEKFADEVVEVAYETLEGNSTGKGLVIVGVKGEPHPIQIFRQFLELARTGQLDPGVNEAVTELEGRVKALQEMIKFDADDETGITFETIMPALPVPLIGTASRLYQRAWSEGFDAARVATMFKALTRDDLTRDDLKRYDWVFYLPPQSATSAVLKDMLNKGMKAEKMGIIKRAALRTAVFAAGPIIRKAAEGMRKAMLFSTILRAESDYSKEDIDDLTEAYAEELMPDLKPGNIGERRRVLAAIERQKIENAEYAKNPYVKPARLTAFDPAAYAAFAGDYTTKPPQATHHFICEGESYRWQRGERDPQIYFPAGDRLFVKEDGTATIQFLVDDIGAVTGVEERWHRGRRTIQRAPAVSATTSQREPVRK
ncbi:MAG TPA: hypothetical protein VGD88_12780 [Opitutaceae bacterium]